MKTYFQHKLRSHPGWALGTSVLFFVVVLASPAFAALGRSLDSVQDDQAHMRATAKVSQAGTYAVHELTTPSGTLVREYVSADGRVFGVAWQGPFIPDMQQLLGSYFQHFSQSAKAQRETHVGQRFLDIEEPGFVVQTGGHMRAYFGRAYDPGLLPAGVSANDIR